MKSVPETDNSINLNSLFFADPVVSCRVEDEEGAILFNPDIDMTTLINTSGLAIWNYIQEAHTIEEIYKYLCSVYIDCPAKEEILKDITQFVSDLTPDFIQEGEISA